MHDFARYHNKVPTEPSATVWMPDIPSLVLGGVLGAIFTLIVFSKMGATQVSSVPEPSQLVVEQPQDKPFKFDFYDVLKYQ